MEKQRRRDRRNQHAREVEASQEGLRKSIAETERLVSQSEEMLRRHRKEVEDDEEAPPEAAKRDGNPT